MLPAHAANLCVEQGASTFLHSWQWCFFRLRSKNPCEQSFHGPPNVGTPARFGPFEISAPVPNLIPLPASRVGNTPQYTGRETTINSEFECSLPKSSYQSCQLGFLYGLLKTADLRKLSRKPARTNSGIPRQIKSNSAALCLHQDTIARRKLVDANPFSHNFRSITRFASVWFGNDYRTWKPAVGSKIFEVCQFHHFSMRFARPFQFVRTR